MIFPSCPNKQKKSPHKKKKRKINFVYNLPSTENISMTKLLNSEADSSLRVGVANISFLVWQWGSGRKKSGTKRHWATRHCKQFAKRLRFMHDEIINCVLYIQKIHWQTTHGNFISGIMSFSEVWETLNSHWLFYAFFPVPQMSLNLQLLFLIGKSHGLYADRGQLICKE